MKEEKRMKQWLPASGDVDDLIFQDHWQISDR